MLQAADHALMEASLEAIAEVCEDLTPPVYDRFFRAHPEARALFRMDERTRGRMLNEILQLLLEQAEGRVSTELTLWTFVLDHKSYGDVTLGLYKGLLDALIETMAAALGEPWAETYGPAWVRQCDRLMAGVRSAMGWDPLHQQDCAPTALAS